MWHEARRQERKIRGMLVDYRRRAERRRDFYEKIKADPTQFLQIHGRQCKIHLDPAIAAAADSAVMMAWQGQADNLIDRFDVRAHLDYIPPVTKKEEEPEVSQEERQLNYERYRIIAQNSFLSISEEKFLKQLHLEEQFGYTETKVKKEPRSGGAAIGFNYEDGTGVASSTLMTEPNEDDSEDNSDSDVDVDLAINVSKMDPSQAHEMNKHGRSFGMSSNDFYSFLTNDLEEAETYRLAKEEEHEKALFSGRKSRRERRAHREKRLANRVISPPSYAARTSPTYPTFRESKSPSKSPSPENTGKITYITSFGGDEETPSSSKPSYADKVKYGKSKKPETKENRVVFYKRSRSRSRDRSYNARKRRKSRSTSRTRKSRSDSKSKRSRSKSRRSRSKSRTRRSRSKSRRTRSNSRSVSKRSRSRSRNRYKRSRSTSKSRGSRTYRSRWSSSSSSSTSSSSSSSKSQSSSSSASKSPVVTRTKSKSPVLNESAPKVIPRYYGRKKSDQSSSDLSDSSQPEETELKPAVIPVGNETKSGYGNSGTAIKKISTTQMTVQDRLKRKIQALLNKQFKADKTAEQLKAEREKQEQQTREDELREIALKLRRRQREKRHAYDSNRSSSSSESDSDSKSPSSPVEQQPKSRSSSPRRKSKEKDVRKREYRRESSRDKDKREYSRERDRRAHSRSNREHSREHSSKERRGRERVSSPYIRKSPELRIVTKERDRWRDDRERNRKEDRVSKSLVDY